MFTGNDPRAAEGLKMALALNLTLLANYAFWFVGLGRPFSLVIMAVLAVMLLVAVARPRPSAAIYWPVTGFAALLILFALSTPTVAWDARSIWLFHAKRICIDNNLFAQLDAYCPWSHNDYPVMIPSLSATLAQARGFWNEVFPKTASVIFLIPPLFIVAAFIGHQGALVLFLMGLTTLCGANLFNGLVDANLALNCLAILMLLTSMAFNPPLPLKKYKPLLLGTASSSLAILVLTKNEGILAAGIFSVLLALLCLVRRDNLSVRDWLWVCVPPLLFAGAWKGMCHQAGIYSEFQGSSCVPQMINRMAEVQNWRLIASHLFRHSWVAMVVVSLLQLRFFPPPRPYIHSWAFAAAFSLGYLGCLSLVYFGTPYDLAWHVGSSADRIIMTVNVVIFGHWLIISWASVQALLHKTATTPTVNP